jgi:hypothetical protein
MCQYHSWFRDEQQGFVIECNACGKIQVAFGMVMASFREPDFHTFREYIRSKFAGLRADGNPNEKNILLNTPCESLSLLFSYGELGNLHDLLEQADTEMKTHKMLQLFEE